MYRRMRWKDDHNAQHTSTSEVKYRWMWWKDDHSAQHTSISEVIYRRMRLKDDHNAQHTSTTEVVYRIRCKDGYNAQHTSTTEVVYRIRCKDDHNAQHTSTAEVIYRQMRWKDDHNALCLCVCGLFLDTVSIWKKTWKSLEGSDYITDWKVQGSNPGRNKSFSSFLNCPDWLWGPPRFLFKRYRSST
jgi:hypothetical protein